MKILTRSGTLLGIGAACIISAFVLFYATVTLGQLAILSGMTFMDDDNEWVAYRAPFILWAIPVLLLAGGIACLVLHVRVALHGKEPGVDAELPH